MRILGLVPARGGSKGIKNKNIIDLAGKPLIGYVTEALKKSSLVDKVICTTDSEEIVRVAKRFGAEVPFMRPAELSQDDSPVFPALIHAVKKIEELQNYKPDYIVTIQPTSPFVQVEQIDRAIRLAIEKRADSVVAVTALEHDCHPYNIREISPDGLTRFWLNKEHYQYPTRQSKPKFYKFGNLYVTSYDTLVHRGLLEGEKNYSVEIDKIRSMDINDSQDLALAKELIKQIL